MRTKPENDEKWSCLWCFVVTCYKKNNSMWDDTGCSWMRENFDLINCYFNWTGWTGVQLCHRKQKIITGKKHSGCIITTKEANKIQSLTLPPRNEYAFCVNLVFKVSAEARLTQNTPAFCTGKVLCVWMRLVLPKIVLLTVEHMPDLPGAKEAVPVKIPF